MLHVPVGAQQEVFTSKAHRMKLFIHIINNIISQKYGFQDTAC